VVDLFALPLAGIGIAAGFHLLAPDASRRARERFAIASLLAIFVLAGALALRNALPGGERFRIANAMALNADMAELLPERAAILGDRPMAEIFRCFVNSRSQVLNFLVGSGSLHDPELSLRLDEIVQRGEPVYVVTSRDSTLEVLRGRFGLSLVRTIPAEEYGLHHRLENGSFSLHRLMPGTRTEIE
jgi:hypothetical protein